jgi:hypothetical protein
MNSQVGARIFSHARGTLARCLPLSLARQGRADEGLCYSKRALEIYRRLQISPERMEKALTALRECEAGVTKISEL